MEKSGHNTTFLEVENITNMSMYYSERRAMSVNSFAPPFWASENTEGGQSCDVGVCSQRALYCLRRGEYIVDEFIAFQQEQQSHLTCSLDVEASIEAMPV